MKANQAFILNDGLSKFLISAVQHPISVTLLLFLLFDDLVLAKGNQATGQDNNPRR